MDDQAEYLIKRGAVDTETLTSNQWLWLLQNGRDIDFEIKEKVLYLPMWAIDALNEI